MMTKEQTVAVDAAEQYPFLTHGVTWEEMAIGSRYRTTSRTITETDLITFVNLANYHEPLFRDADGSADAGYTGRLIPGALTYCVGEGLIFATNIMHGTALAFLAMSFSVCRPAYVGVTIHVDVEVTAARATSRGRGLVTTRNVIRDAHGEDLIVYEPTRLVRGRNHAG